MSKIERLREISDLSALLHEAIEGEMQIINARLIEIQEKLKKII